MLLQNRIDEFEQKHRIDFNELLVDFEGGMSRADLCDKYGVTELPLRKFIYSLGLDFVKNKRKESIDYFTYMLGRENGESPQVIKELSDELNAISKDNIKLHKSLITTRDSNTSLRRQIREVTREALVDDNLLEHFSKYLLENEINVNYINIKGTKVVEHISDGLCVVFGDEHIGEEVDTTNVNNKYNYDIAEARLHYVVKQTLLFPYQSTNINVFMLLDSLRGLIHDGMNHNEGGFTTAVIKLVEIYAGIFETLSCHYNEVFIHTTLDNHGRVSEKPATKNRMDNFSVMAIKMIEMLLHSRGIKNITFNFSKGDYNFTEINGAGICAFHGDTIRQYKAYSTTQTAKVQDVCLNIFNKPAKHFISGHQHVSMICANQYGGTNIQNGTVVGNNEYGVSTGFAPIQPSQTIFFVNKFGDIETTKVVSLQHIK